jgi:15-cis-phytoene synthase
MHSPEDRIFKTGSTTFYWSTRFFPKTVREDVARLYSFVRVADDYVDAVPAKISAFYDLCDRYHRCDTGKRSWPHMPPNRDVTLNDTVVANILDVARRYRFDPRWLEAFLAAMESDLHPRAYGHLSDTLAYVHGSAEVIGLMMCRIMGLPPALAQEATMQGRAFQWINFIRDIAEDTELGRCYFPQSDLRRFRLPDLTQATVQARSKEFAAFLRYQIERYAHWQDQASNSYEQLPKRLRVPLQTAARLYDWTAQQILRDPLIVFESKIKPTAYRVLRTGLAALWT